MVASMDSRGRSRLFGCFNSAPHEDEPSFHSAAPPSPPPPPLADDESVRRKRTALRNLSGSLKSVFFKAPLVKKLKSKRSFRRESYRSISSLSSKLKKPAKKLKSSYKGFSEMEDILGSDDSDRFSLFSSTSSNSCASSFSSSGSERIKQCASAIDLPLAPGTNYNRQNVIKSTADGGSKCKYGAAAATGMCIFLVCLVALVFWGKAIAIVTCTSAWLFLAVNYRRSHAGEAAVNRATVNEAVVNNIIDSSEEEKKRVIMEGLLERTRPKVIQP